MADLADNQLHIVLVNAVVLKEGKVLISQRSFEETHMPGKWTIPGGKVDQTEGVVWNMIEKTLAQEVEEETDVKIKERVTLVTNNTFIRSTGHHVIALVFRCEWQSGEAKPLEDTIAVRWVSREEFDQFDFAPGVKDYIKKAFETLGE